MLPDILKLLHTESPDVANLICSLTNFYYENTRHEYLAKLQMRKTVIPYMK